MSRYLKLFVSVLMIVLLSPLMVHAQEDTRTTDSTEEVVLDSVADENTNEETSVDKITIYVDENCPHCKAVEDFADKYGISDNINYVQLSDSEENFNDLQAIWDEFGVSDQEKGWPFMVYEENGVPAYEVGDSPIIEFLTEKYQIEVDEADQQDSSGSTGNSALLLLGGFFFFSIIGYVIYSMVVDKQEK